MAEPLVPHVLLKQAREKRGWTQAQLAELLGESDSGTVSRWERARAKPRPHQRVNLAKLLGIPLEAWVRHADQGMELREDQLLRPLHEGEQPYPDIWTVPFNIPFFIGRQDILQRLREALLEGKTTVLTQVISGLGGIGKTLTAARYASLYRKQYTAVFWVEAQTQEKLLAGLLKMADDLNLPERQLEDTDQILAAVKRWMREQAYWLLILDDVEDMALALELLPIARRGHVLLTTRKQPTAHTVVNIELTGLSLEEGALLLLQRAGRLAVTASLEQASDQDRIVAKQLSFQMEGLPLALEQAGAYIQEQECSLAEYLEWYKKRRAYLLQWRSSQHPDDAYTYPYSVATTWSLSFEKIRQGSPEAVDLLSFLSFLDPDAIPEELLLMSASELGPRLEHISATPELLEVLAHLRRYSFVRRVSEQQVVSIHRLVQAVFKDNMDEETQKRWAERAVRAVDKAFIQLKEKPLREQDRYFPHAQQCYEWITQMALHFSDAAQLLLLLGEYAQKRMFYNEAEKYLLQAIAIIEKLRAPTHVERAVAYNNIAALYEEMGNYSLADIYLRKAVPILEQKSASPDMKILLARAINNIAGTQEKLNNLVEAEQYARRAIEIIRQVENASVVDVVYVLNTYEVILYRLHKHEEARQVTQQIDAIFHPEQESDLDRARMLEKQGEKQVPIQIDLIEQALGLFQQVYGPEHREIAHCLSAIGAGYIERADYIQAKSYFQQALDMYVHLKQAEHSDVVVILMQLGICSFFLKEPKEASAFFEQAQKMAEKNPSPYVSEQMMKMFKEVSKTQQPD